MAMKRITFGEDEKNRMSNALRMAFGSVMAEPSKASVPPAAESVVQPEGEGCGQAREEYEKRVIMESVRRAKERSGLAEEGVSVIPVPRETQQSCPSKARYVPLPLEALCSEEIGFSERLVYLYICANCFCGRANLSIRELSNELYISKSKVTAAVAALRELEWLTWEAPRSGKSRKNHYKPLKWLPDDNVLKIGELLINGNMLNSGNLSNNSNMPKSDGYPNLGNYPKIGNMPNTGKLPENSDMPEIGKSPNIGNMPENSEHPKSASYPNSGNLLNYGDIPEYGDNLKSGNMPILSNSVESLANTDYIDDVPKSDVLPDIGKSPNFGDIPENGKCPEIGESSNSGDMPDFSNSEESLAISGFSADVPENGNMPNFSNMPENEDLPNSVDRRKTVDTTEFWQDLIEILRTVKTVDLKDLKDIKILKDLKDNKNKISDYVNNLCITRVDNSMVAEYVSTMFRIAFPGQSTEKLQVVRKLTERLQVGFAWYVVLLYIIKSSPYLMGKEKNSEGWKCTLTWALAAENYPKIMQLTYVKYGLRWTPQNFIEYLCRALEKGEY